MKAEHRRPLIAFLLVTVVCFAMMVHAIRTDALGGFARLDPARVVAGQLLVPKPVERPAVPAVEPPVVVSSAEGPVTSDASRPTPSFSPGASTPPTGHAGRPDGSDGKVGSLTGGLVGGAVGYGDQPADEPGDSPTGEVPSSPPSSTTTPGHGPWGEGRPGAVGAPPATPATPTAPSEPGAPSTPSTPGVPNILDQAIDLLGGRHDHGHHEHGRHDDGRSHGPTGAGWGHSGDDRGRGHGHDRDRGHDRGHGWGH